MALDTGKGMAKVGFIEKKLRDARLRLQGFKNRLADAARFTAGYFV
jgi:hypothetical protein